MLADGLVSVSYPTGLTLDLKGEPNIDTRADRESRNGVEKRIPLSFEGAMMIFHAKEDYELRWAMAYLESGQAEQ